MIRFERQPPLDLLRVLHHGHERPPVLFPVMTPQETQPQRSLQASYWCCSPGETSALRRNCRRKDDLAQHSRRIRDRKSSRLITRL